MKVRCGERISTSARLMEIVTSDEGRKVQDQTWVSCFAIFLFFGSFV